jgi:hypothetical protein
MSSSDKQHLPCNRTLTLLAFEEAGLSRRASAPLHFAGAHSIREI